MRKLKCIPTEHVQNVALRSFFSEEGRGQPLWLALSYSQRKCVR